MELEIFSQKEVLERIFENYTKDNTPYFKGLCLNFEEIKFIASGSSYNAARLGHKFFENYTTKRVSFEYASEFISNENKKIKNDTLYCFISQSGETYDTKYAQKIVKNEGGKTLALVNNSNSTIYNEADYKIDVLAGVENSIAATKSFLACVICLWLLAITFSKDFDKENMGEFKNEALVAIEDVLNGNNALDMPAKLLSEKNKLSIIGYHYGYILAKELALKIKETSYIDTTAYPTGEFLHGHTAILNSNKTLIEIYTESFSKFEENTLKKIKNDFNPEIIEITDKEVNSKNAIRFKKYKTELAKICAITVILQLLALKCALKLGLDVDKPKGLKKVVSN